MSRLITKMRDTVRLYTFSVDAYGRKIAFLSSTTVGLLRPSLGINRVSSRIDETPGDAILWLNPNESVVASRAGKIQGLIVNVVKQNYRSASDSEDWYEIQSAIVAEDLLLKNRARFIKCTLIKIEAPEITLIEPSNPLDV